ncbi:MAG: hypothetical protein K6E47_05310 [Lachnospiraceae bacterium]|nr:hypothetical protein [Lachnospiraceae bacterium]
MKKEYSPVLPFDGTMEDKFSIYDEEKYTCRVDLYQTEKPIKLHHNSMVKYYSYGVDVKPVRLGGG